MYKIEIYDRSYERYDILEVSSQQIVALPDFDPVQHKLFDGDVFTNHGGSTDISESSVRKASKIAGVLVLDSGKTFGKYRDKKLFKCVPNDRKLPIFLIPFAPKQEFSKYLRNKYILFVFANWTGNHPQASIVQIIGDVATPDNFYEYKLHCKNLHTSGKQFTKVTMRKLKSVDHENILSDISKRYVVSDREAWDVITIDPCGSKDFDDAFSLVHLSAREVLLTVYIANVSLWLDVMQLWEHFGSRIATIYLPHRKCSMLPNILADALCSLQAGQVRFALAMDLTIDVESGVVRNVTFLNTRIRVSKNHTYDSVALENCTHYDEVFKVAIAMNARETLIDRIETSHDVIAYLMLLMNSICARRLEAFGTGLFRSAACGSHQNDNRVKTPLGLERFLKIWKSTGGHYAPYASRSRHEVLGFEVYTHITSPIRRVVDLLNILELQRKLELCTLSASAREFYLRWADPVAIQELNKTMKAIRRVQNDCALLNRCVCDQSLLDCSHKGYILDRHRRDDGSFSYTVYLSEITLVSRFVSDVHKEVYSEHSFRIHLFTDEDSLKQKIRVSLL